MADFREEERIKALRERLYARGKDVSREGYELKGEKKEARTTWENPPAEMPESLRQTSRETVSTVINKGLDMVRPKPAPEIEKSSETAETEPMPTKSSKKYRLYIVLAGLVFFVLAVGISSLFFILGGNTISGENIAIDISGPFTVGGGEAIPLQVGVTNQNAIAIESATLIVTYPPDTQSASEDGKELFVERLSLDTIGPGETLNVPLRAIVFGEENQEKTILAEIEYRVEGSNSTFAKEAEPLRFKISSSPVILTVDSLYKVSSGQETDITLTISSNSPNPLTDIIVRAEYPGGFDYTTSDPFPVSGQNVWRIDSLNPEEDTKITITGVVVGDEADEYVMHFSIGVPNDQDRLQLSSVFSTASTEFEIEQPFIGITLEVNNDDSGTVAVEAGESIDVDIEVTNTTRDTILDGRVELSLSGNALSDYDVGVSNGFYDSLNNVVLWDATGVDSLKEMLPGETARFRVNLNPDPDIDITPQLAFDVNARARRLTEGSATEELIGTASAVAKVSSVATLLSEVGRNTSTFSDTGPLPPVAETETTYTITFFAQNSTNDLGDTEVSANLPTYVKWLDVTSGAGTITFNEVSRTVTWNAGTIDANQSMIAAFQIGLLPSKSQIGTTPTLIGEQHLRATDRFTGSIIRTSNRSLTTVLAEEAGYPKGIGVVYSEPTMLESE